MGRINPRDRGIHGDTPATSQDQANRSCYIYNFIPGIALFETIAGNPEKVTVKNDTVNQILLNEFVTPNSVTNVFNDAPNRIALPEANVGVGNTTGLS